MKTTTKTITSLVLVIVFLFSCLFFSIIIFALAWLHTYKVFTEQKPIAELNISALKKDDNGQYFDVSFRQVKGRSPIASVFNPSEKNVNLLEGTQTFKLYGDQIEVGGPVVKFRDFLTLFNFKTVYKIAYLKSEYSDLDEENKRDLATMPRRYDLNGGYSSWRDVQENIQKNTIQGTIMKWFIDNLPQIDGQGVFVTDQEQKITLCVTEEGFYICDRQIEE